MAQDAAKPPRRASPVKTAYLILYNAVSAGLWATILARTISTNLIQDHQFVFTATGELTQWTQTLMAMDILHALFGVVKTSPFTTFLQVASRLVLIWLVQVPLPEVCQSPAYSTQLFAWSLTEVVRYSYLVLKLSGWEPYALLWVRYSSYRILYPVGISSEMIQMWRALGPSKEQGWGLPHQVVLAACLFVIWPLGAYQLIPHMNKQRRKVLAAAKAADTKASQ